MSAVSGAVTGGDTRAVRPGEELPEAALASWLDAQLGGAERITIEQFPGGHSNLTYLVRRAGQEMVLRRPPFGTKVKTAHDMGREFAVLSRLAPVWPLAPRPVAMCEDEAIIGARFYLMERRHGVILRKDAKVAPDDAARICDLLTDALAGLHQIDYAAAGLGEFGKPAGYIERQVKGWSERYVAARTDDIPAVTAVAAWLDAHRPADGAPALIHNDFKFDNLIFDEALTRVTGILDWEMATIGDPLMDLGTSLGYWVQADDPQPLQMMRFGATTLPGMRTRAEVATRYARARGIEIGDLVFYYAFGLFKTAVVAQQIYARFAAGLTKDPRFATFIHGVRVLAEQAERAIAAGAI